MVRSRVRVIRRVLLAAVVRAVHRDAVVDHRRPEEVVALQPVVLDEDVVHAEDQDAAARGKFPDQPARHRVLQVVVVDVVVLHLPVAEGRRRPVLRGKAGARGMVETDADDVVVHVVALDEDVVRDRDLEARRALREIVLDDADVLGGLDPQRAVARPVGDVLLHLPVRGERRPDAVLEVVDRLVALDVEVVRMAQPDPVVREAFHGEALDLDAVDVGIARLRGLDKDALALAGVRQDADLRVGQGALADQLEGLGHVHRDLGIGGLDVVAR